MAFQADLPFLMFKTSEVSLLGVTNRNLWIEIAGDLSPKGKVKFHVTQDLLLTSLRDLKKKALERRAKMRRTNGKPELERFRPLSLVESDSRRASIFFSGQTVLGNSIIETGSANPVVTETDARLRKWSAAPISEGAGKCPITTLPRDRWAFFAVQLIA